MSNTRKPIPKANEQPATPIAFHQPGAQIGQATFINGPAQITIASQHIAMPSAPKKPAPAAVAQTSKSAVSQVSKPAAPPPHQPPATPQASRKNQQFDVFLSHNSKDKPAVRKLKRRLAARGLSAWLDVDELQPGIAWQKLLEAGIKSSASVAVLIGKDGLGPWEDEEMQGALRLAVKDKRPVIPVLLPGAPTQPDLPMFLTNRTWVDLRAGFTKPGLDLLEWGITGTKPETSPSPAPPPPRPSANAQAVYAFVVQRMRAVLEVNPRLRADLEQALRLQLPEAAQAAAGIVEMVFKTGLNEVLEAIYHWLEGQTRREDVEAIRELLDGLAALGVDADWVAKARDGLAPAKGTMRGGLVIVPRTTEMPTAEVLKAALRDGPCYWARTPGNPLPVGEDGFDASVEPSSPTLRSRLAEFRAYLMKRCVVQPNDPDAQKTLAEHLEVRWRQRKPLYALFGEADGLPQHLAQDPSIPWQFLLVMQKDRAVEDVLQKPRATAVWLNDILAQIDRVSPHRPSR